MRIALISEHASPLATQGGVDSGGQNVYVAYVARQLGRAGHRVDVFTRRDDPSLPRTVDFARNVRVIHVPAGPARPIPKEQLLPHMGEFCDEIAAWCEHVPRQYDVAHANFFMSGVAAQRLRDAFGIPYVVTFHALGRVRRFHQGNADAFPPQRIEIEDALVANADRVIAECPQDFDDLVRLYRAREERINVVPCGVDTSELGFGDGLARQRLGIAENEFVVLQLGRMVPRKGVDNVIRGVGALRREHGIGAKLLIVGGESPDPDPGRTPEIGRLQRVAEEEGVADCVVFTGQRTRAALRDYYCAADVFVTTPWYEPFGITPLEAMACGRPVIGAAVGGIAHTVVDGETGYLVPPNDPVRLADRLARLYRNPENARAFGRAGMHRVRHHFTWKQVANALADVYESLCRPDSTDPVRAGARTTDRPTDRVINL